MSTTLVIGGRSFYLRIAPVDDAQGKRVGFVVNWADRTAEVAAEEQVQAVIEAAAAGELGRRIDVSSFEGFMQRLGGNINSLMDTVVDPVRETIEVSRALAEGNLAVSIKGDHQGEFGDLKTSVNGFVDQLNAMIGRCATIIEEVAVAANQVRDSSQQVSSAAERQTEAVQGSSASLTETASMVKANAENAGIANDLVSETSDAAREGNDRMGEMMSAMQAIEQSSADIAKIIKVIDEIAFQTNLLALNAAVEAARAGKYGKGFAVVAQEVRTLAERSAKAAKETAEIIENSRAKVTEGATLSRSTSESLGRIVENVMKVRDLVAEITAASDEQSRGVTNITEAMEDIAQGTESSNHQASSLAAAATEMSRQTEVLRSELGRFRLKPASTGKADLSELSPEMVAKLMAMLKSEMASGSQPAATPPAAPASSAQSPAAAEVFPLDQDERGFEGF
jgi:methyl-accepting chemotaxis protein